MCPKAPIVLGHEATGVIDKVGGKVKSLKVGDRVFVSHHVPCNKCRYCKRGYHTACHTLHTTNYYPGGFSQYIRVPKINIDFGIYKLPDDMSFEEGTFIEPLACVSRGQRLANLQKDDTRSDYRQRHRRNPAHPTCQIQRLTKTLLSPTLTRTGWSLPKNSAQPTRLNAKDNLPAKLKEINDGHLADQVIVCTGATSASLSALDCVDNGGTILFFAVPDPTVKLPVPINQFWRNEITMQTSYGAAPNDLEDSLRVLATKQLNVKDMITHRLPLSEAQEGFRLMAEAGQSLKVILEPNRV